MLFTSLQFVLFLALTMLLFYLLPTRGQRGALLLANYVFYMWWEPKFGLLLLAGTAATYAAARALQARLWGRRKLWLALGVTAMLGQLILFKYGDFFLRGAARLVGAETAPSLGLLLPIGISFYSFAAAGYLFDVYRGKLAAEKNFLDFALFLSFFPSILSGPIPRARELLPQFKVRHAPDGAGIRRGLLRCVWGAAKKLVAADALLTVVNTAYAAPESFTGGQLLFAVCAYSVYIYLDFSSYSDMAIGTAHMLGFRLMENFNAPYCARSVRDFWRRWHISLTSWFREYLFFPLGGSRVPRWRTCLNILIVFAVSGLWHGAAMTFVVWGVLNGVYQVVGQLTDAPRRALRERLHIGENGPLHVAAQLVLVFALMTCAWVFFRADSLGQAVYILKGILRIGKAGLGAQPLTQLGLSPQQFCLLPVFLAPFVVEDIQKARGRAAPAIESWPWRYCLLLGALLLFIAVFGAYGTAFDQSEFVYFRF
jgi:D-alanyl-lipoteichoic acid acyltransferase DltB (MBOAT superfamily)